MSSFGVLSTGFVRKTVQDILDELEADEKSAFGSDVDVSADSVFGQINGVFAGALGEAWELAEAVYSAQYPSSANDASLDKVAAITGSIRSAATQSTASVTCTGTAGTSILVGREVSHTTTGERFTNLTADTLVAVTAWAGSTAYVVGDRRSNGGNTYICVTAGTSASSGGPTTEDAGIVDGTVVWDFVGNGTAAVDITFTALNFGPVAAPAGALVNIETPIAGWDSCRNLLDGSLGSNLETDEDFRIRRENELAIAGDATLEAIRSNVLLVTGVLEAQVYENVSEFTDADGRPPHSIEVVVRTTTGDTPDATIDQAVADAVFATKASGIETFGHPSRIVSKTVVDSTGSSHTVEWTRVEDIEIYVDVSVDTNTDPADGAIYPIDGDAQVSAAIVAAGADLEVGQDVIAKFIECQAFDVDGVVDVTAFTIDTVTPPVGTSNITITARQVAVFDTSRINVTS